MKKFLLTLCAICITMFAFAQTETLNWYMDGNTYATTTCESGGDILLPTTPTKRGYTFMGWQSYTPVEYLESTGTQYIDTGYYPNQDTGVKTKFQIIRTGNTVFFGKNKNNGGAFESFIWGGKLYFTYNSSDNPVQGFTITPNDILEYDWNKNIISYSKNDVRQTNVSFPGQFFSAIKTFFLFAENNDNNSAYLASIKIYYFQIYDNNILVRDMIPVLDINGTPCMFDKVEHKFYYNAGTGNFIAGPEVGFGE